MIYEIEAEITIKKRYFVEASSEAEAIQELAESGVVGSEPEEDRDEDYEVEYTVIRLRTKAQLEKQGAELDIDGPLPGGDK